MGLSDRLVTETVFMGWKIGQTYVQARKQIFTWHDDEHLHDVFQRACEAGVDNVERLLEERKRLN